jgi:hypothetical protein
MIWPPVDRTNGVILTVTAASLEGLVPALAIAPV